MSHAPHEIEVPVELDPADLCGALAADQHVSLLLDGRGFDDGWDVGPLVALGPRVVLEVGDSEPRRRPRLEELEARVRARRSAGGTRHTGIALVLSYEAFDPAGDSRPATGLPRLVAITVDESLRFLGAGRALWTRRELGSGCTESSIDRVVRGPCAAAPARAVGPVRTSLPRATYLAAVERIRRHVWDGDVYQANLCQSFRGEFRGDPCARYAQLARAAPAPRSAFVATPGWALASISPELFLRVESDRVETWPIKGTRPRGGTAEADRALCTELLASPKDRAELLMIVDLERNDLGRVCRPGSIVVEECAAVRSYPTLHHLVGRVGGTLRPAVSLEELLDATFPGGSISGAPKLRARQILAGIEPVRRGFFTGSLCWLGDDGSLESSILIRSVVFAEGRFALGAGGGIVADSDAQAEWEESNHKARVLATSLGFAPEEAR